MFNVTGATQPARESHRLKAWLTTLQIEPFARLPQSYGGNHSRFWLISAKALVEVHIKVRAYVMTKAWYFTLLGN
jgi:hypothetical protein